MGNMVTATLLTDCWSSFEADPARLLDEIWELATRQNRNIDGYGGGLTVMPYRHADMPGLFFTHRNSTFELSKWAHRTDDLARRNGAMRELLLDSITSARWFLDDLESHVHAIEKGESP